jgi:hydrogenase maturation protein HypF
MLPYTPLHHLLLEELGFPVVATSGNRAEEPICTDEWEALARLGGIAAQFLVHDRPIRRHVDDSLVRVVAGRELVLRRARGYAPLPVRLRQGGAPVVGVGAHLKNAVAVAIGQEAFVSQHIGDLETVEAYAAFQRVEGDLQKLYGVRPRAVAGDLHPDYLSSRFAAQLAEAEGVEQVAVQHHHAHVLACMAENQLTGRVLGIAWDGTGYGTDRTVWGGEFLLADETGFTRFGHLRAFRLPGGEKAVQEPRRAALGLLYEIFGEEVFARSAWPPVAAFSPEELRVVGQQLRRGFNAPSTSSAGRLFDAVAALVGLRQRLRYEGQGAMELEFRLEKGVEEGYGMRLVEGEAGEWIVDWEPMIRQLLGDVEGRVPVGRMAARFHNSLVEAMVAVARQAGEARMVLTGGCMQNKYLTERAVRRLQEEGFRPYWHQRVPPNDGGIALGQVVAARARID